MLFSYAKAVSRSATVSDTSDTEGNPAHSESHENPVQEETQCAASGKVWPFQTALGELQVYYLHRVTMG